jgi:hypothetical protein
VLDVALLSVCNMIWVQFAVSVGGFHHSGYHRSGLSPTPSVRVAKSMDIPAHMSFMICPNRGLLVM